MQKGKKKRDNVGIWVEGGKEVILVCSLVTTDMWRYMRRTCFTVPNNKIQVLKGGLIVGLWLLSAPLSVCGIAMRTLYVLCES